MPVPGTGRDSNNKPVSTDPFAPQGHLWVPTWSDPINPQLGAKNLNASPGRFGSRNLMWRYGKIWWRCPTLVPEMTSVNQDQWSTNHDQNPDVANFANFGIVESCWIHLPAYQMHGTSKRTLGSLGMFQSADCNFYSCDLWEHHPWKTQECWGDHSWIGAFSGAALTSFLGLHKEFCGLWGWFVLQTQTCARSQMKATVDRADAQNSVPSSFVVWAAVSKMRSTVERCRK